MSKLIFVMIVFNFFNFCRCDAEGSKIKVGVNIKDFRSIKIDLINNTDSVSRFWIMSCSWEDSFVFNMDMLQLTLSQCDKNVEQLIELIPGQKITYYGTIGSAIDSEILSRNDLKIGFIFIKEKEFSITSDLMEIMTKKRIELKNIIWSEPFKLKR